jgi:hypothetical protein
MNSRWLVLLLIALVILLALYVASLGVGLRGGREPGREAEPGDRRLSLNAPWVRSLRQRMTARLKGEELRLADGPEGCRLDGNHLQVPVGGACEFEIAPADKTRALRLKLVQGSAAAFSLAQAGALAIEGVPLAPGEASEAYDVYRGTASARLTVTGCETPEEGEAAFCRLLLE